MSPSTGWYTENESLGLLKTLKKGILKNIDSVNPLKEEPHISKQGLPENVDYQAKTILSKGLGFSR